MLRNVKGDNTFLCLSLQNLKQTGSDWYISLQSSAKQQRESQAAQAQYERTVELRPIYTVQLLLTTVACDF